MMNSAISEFNKRERELLAPLLQKAKIKNEILALSVYGSFARGEKYRDIDICLFIFPEIYAEFNKLNFLLKFYLDLSEKFDVHIFQDLPLYIQERVLNEGKILLNKDFNTLFDIYEETHKSYNLFIPHYRHYLGMDD